MKLLRASLVLATLVFVDVVGSQPENQLVVFKSLKKICNVKALDDQAQERQKLSRMVPIYKSELKACLYPSLVHSRKQTPRIIIDSVENKTPYDLVVTNRYSDSSLPVLPAGVKAHANYEVENYVNVSSGFEKIQREAQFVVKAVGANNPYLQEQSYVNMSIGYKGRKSFDPQVRKIFKFLAQAQDDTMYEFENKVTHCGFKNIHLCIAFYVTDQSAWRSNYQKCEKDAAIQSWLFDTIVCGLSDAREK